MESDVESHDKIHNKKMRYLSSALLGLYLSLLLISAINTHRGTSFLNHSTSERDNQSLQSDELDAFESPEAGPRRGKGGVFSKVKDLFYSDGKTLHKTQNNVLLLSFEGFKNVRNKKVVDNTHLQVQKTSDLFTNNSEKGVLHFSTTMDKIGTKGNINRATLKLNKLFDAKTLGFTCPTNGVKLYLIDALNDDLKVKILKGPIKLEFKKNEVEVDVTNFFNDLKDDTTPPPVKGNLMQFLDLSVSGPPPPRGSPGDDDLEFDDETEDGGDKREDDNDENFFGKEGGNTEEGDEPSPLRGERVDKYLMLEADENCYFGFDMVDSKPKVRIETTKKLTTRLKQANKMAIGGVATAVALVVLGAVFVIIRSRRTDYSYFYDKQNETASLT
ncbi:uncharacterized protein TA08235 [Theileria annulata]|uniref:Uncharacterized protein n=1 Tax=Theileria annulata TaxID=5874 RepID=Q4U9R4_THEAN|nr:uncharacterized protein TA08235 [Theileria annulata]CAI76439.1 hypothetical protein TA08235 [Theileria annulata]|eukprot:XP_953064.1 hypothetical protein TA08235 [Theileria annulata]